MRFFYLFIILPFFAVAQNCNICPSGTTVSLTSSYSPTATHQWTCTNGFTSNLVNPTFAPIADVTCNLLVTENGCTATSQTIVDVCNCECNDPCVAMNYNSTTDCVTFNNTGSNCSPTATDVIQWKNQNTSFATIANGGQICNCDIKEYVNTTANVTVVSTNFRLNINGLNNRCPGCTGSNMRIDFQFPITGSTSSFPGCAATNDWLTISPTDFANNGYICDVYMRYTTLFGVVVNQYRFAYNGGGLNVANVTVTEISKKTIYKDITAKRTVTYSDGCPTETCELTLDIPQQPNDPCTHFVAYVSNVNLGSPCSGAGYNANTINGVAPLTYQWYYNGTAMSGQTSQFLCLVGQPDGTYCVQVTDGNGCIENVCRVKQASCSLTASITAAGNTLNSTVTGCTGTRTNQWQWWNGSTWINVGTGNSYNTGGVSGDYRLNVTCSGPPICNAIANYTFTPPCTADVTITTGTTTLTANVTGCGGTNITYIWERWNGSAWVTVQTVTTTSTSNIYTPTLSGLYRVSITCNGCSDQAQTSFTLPNPCTGFSATMTGTFTDMCNGTSRTFGRTTTGGTAPFTQVWTLNGSSVGTATTYNFTPPSTGTYVIAVTVTDANNCTFTDTRNITVIQCCGMTLSISPTTTSVCTNQDATFTVTPSGGTAPYTYAWTYSVPSGPVIGAGTGNPKTFNFPTANTYTIVCTVTDALGCQVSIFATMTVTTCTSCVCTPSLTLAGCILTGSFAGAGCGSFTYQLQYSATGTGWSVVQSGLASTGGSFTHTPTANGFYRLVINASGCGTFTTADVSVTCFNPTCTNPTTLTLSGTGQTICGLSPITISGNTFGGSATSVTITENGTGTITPSSSGTSPFSFTYTPTSGDYLQTVTVTVTTNNPLGNPCVPQTRTYGITVNPIPTPTITSTNANICVGQTRTITTNPTGGTLSVSGPATLVGNTLTATGIGTITLTYSLTSQGCTGTTTQMILSESCPCDGLSMTITPVIGGVSFGTLNFNGVAQTNYRIEWRKCSDNSVVFTSGMGTGAGTGIYPHPSSNIPLVGDCYYAFIVFSPQGSNLDCFPDFTVANWTCLNPPSYTYNGPGGASATREFRMDISTSTNIRIGNFQTQVVPDLLEVIYNGVTIYSSNNQTSPTQTPFVIPITYVSGQNYVTFMVTNSNPSSNTIWSISDVSCCSTINCPTQANVPQITSISSALNASCGCTLTPTYSTTALSCSGCGNPSRTTQISSGDCTWQQLSANNTCENETVVITKLTGASKSFDFSSSTNYLIFKNMLQGATGDQMIRYYFHSQTCGNDGTQVSYNFMPTHHTITYDDVNFIVTVTVSSTNPFSNNCTNCNAIKFAQYASIYSIFNTTQVSGTFLSIRSRRSHNAGTTNVNPSTFSSIITCSGGTCGANLDRRYRISYRNTSCPCQSWQLHEDTDDNGTYETLVLEAAGWTGSCL